jgi:hypothetical protein
LKKKELTKDPFFHLTTLLIGICVTDSWKLSDFHKLMNQTRIKEDKKMTVTRIAGILQLQLLNNAASIGSDYPNTEQTSTSPTAATVTLNSMEIVSSVRIANEHSVETVQSAVDANGKTHHLVILP